ncbi:DUF3472 domain-containing protein [Pedobacter insulae]|uniref:Ricin-type beta-trefoil lectin domain-like n=1 Tax=Pedobacter insulae TaxID=414048 RepID=A0A1I2THU9_9SPHI|nr:RICIN domain-containing protein [Pedobacter insulae]SFG64512.1 Ricin-type beta-trefoil lectin domain-like [Pedobacter insulae]
MKLQPLSHLLVCIIVLFGIGCKKSDTLAHSSENSTEEGATNIKKTSKTGIAATENAAPSQHLFFTFPTDAILKMHKIKVTQSANSSYFSVHNYTGGYAGIQQTSSTAYGTPNILISSLWDPNTAGNILATASYVAPTTVSSRFGGEGDGAKTINPYNWSLNVWYNVVLRSWKANNKLYIATFIQNLSNNNWFHTSTLTIPERTTFLGKNNDAFLENWEGFQYDGSYERKAFFKDCWNLTTGNQWEKHTSRSFSANANDAYRNGIYDRAFNAGYDANEDAYFMEHGGNVVPSAAFGQGRTLNLPVQTNQGSAPIITTGSITSVSANYSNGSVAVSWIINQTKSPQFSSKVEILNSSGTVIHTANDNLPEKRTTNIPISLSTGNYTARVTITDIFNQVSSAFTSAFVASTNAITTGTYRLVNANTGKSLDNLGVSTNGSGIGIYSTNSGNNQKWVITLNGGYYRISCVSAPGKSLDSGNNTADGSAVIQYSDNTGTNQQWSLVSTGDGYYYIINRTNGKYLDSVNGTTNGSLVKFWSLSAGSTNQKWSVIAL